VTCPFKPTPLPEWSVKHKEFKRRCRKETWRVQPELEQVEQYWKFVIQEVRRSRYSTAWVEMKKKVKKFVKLLRLANRLKLQRDRRHSNFPHRVVQKAHRLCFGPHLEKTCHKKWEKYRELCIRKKTDVAESLQEIETYLEEATQVGELVTSSLNRGRKSHVRWRSKEALNAGQNREAEKHGGASDILNRSDTNRCEPVTF